jgi:hypothetical protein
MILGISTVELIGYIASVLVATSLTMSSIVKLRWFSLAGSSIFSTYGFLIGAMPVGVLNAFIALVNIYYLRKMYSKEESFKVIEINPNGSYVRYFLEFFGKDIDMFFPSFKNQKNDFLQDKENSLTLLVMRNGASAGIFLGKITGPDATVVIDYVKPEFRDLKPGFFLYDDIQELFLRRGVNRIVSQSRNENHSKYLKKIGFEEMASDVGEKIFVKHLNI